MKTVRSLLVLALSLILFNFSTAEKILQKDAEVAQSIAESQQVLVSTDSDLEKSATGYDQNFNKGSISEEYDIADYKGSKGFKDALSFHGNKKGDEEKFSEAGYHDKGGKSYLGHENQKKYFGGHKGSAKGSKGQNVGSKGHTKKGHKNKGFKNLYHKEEYGINKEFYDDDDFIKYHSAHDNFDDFFGSQNGGSNKGDSFKGGKSHNNYGDKGSFEKGKFFDSHLGKKGSHGNNEHYVQDSNFGKKGGHHEKSNAGYDESDLGGIGYGVGNHQGGLGYGHGGSHRGLKHGTGLHSGGHGSGHHLGGHGSGHHLGGYGTNNGFGRHGIVTDTGGYGVNDHGIGSHFGGYGTGNHLGGYGTDNHLGGYDTDNHHGRNEHGSHGSLHGIHGGFRKPSNLHGSGLGGYGNSNNQGLFGHNGLQSSYGDLRHGHGSGYATAHSNFNMKYR